MVVVDGGEEPAAAAARRPPSARGCGITDSSRKKLVSEVNSAAR
jgi:hypothetical protein